MNILEKARRVTWTLVIAAVILFGWTCYRTGKASAAPAPHDPVTIVVGPGTAVKVTVLGLDQDDLVKIVSTFFSRGDTAAQKKFHDLLQRADSLTLVLTTQEHPNAK